MFGWFSNYYCREDAGILAVNACVGGWGEIAAVDPGNPETTKIYLDNLIYAGKNEKTCPLTYFDALEKIVRANPENPKIVKRVFAISKTVVERNSSKKNVLATYASLLRLMAEVNSGNPQLAEKYKTEEKNTKNILEMIREKQSSSLEIATQAISSSATERIFYTNRNLIQDIVPPISLESATREISSYKPGLPGIPR